MCSSSAAALLRGRMGLSLHLVVPNPARHRLCLALCVIPLCGAAVHVVFAALVKLLCHCITDIAVDA